VDAMEAILTRRSIRKYTSEPVTDDELKQLLTAAMNAPSAGNQRPWEFIVIRDRETLNRIPGIHMYAQMLKQAQAAIVVCGDMTKQKYDGFWIQDCSAATQNILLSATAMGLGAVWLGVYPVVERVEDLRKMLDIPGHVVPLSIVSLGRPGEEREASDRYDKSRIHMEKW
jgi:nitroreductase